MSNSSKRRSKKRVRAQETLEHTSATVEKSENEHVGWMSTKSYYTEVWHFVLKDVKGACLGTPVCFRRDGKSTLVDQKIGFDVVDEAQFEKLAQEQAKVMQNVKNKILVWPIGTLYKKKTSAVHWNVFVYSKADSTLVQFDPGRSCTDKIVNYAFDNSIESAIRRSLMNSAHTPRLKTTPFEFRSICQVDQLGADHFCQTWVIIFVDFYLHNTNNPKSIQEFDFLNGGKRLLKAWLWCVYSNLHHGSMTWAEYVAKNGFASLFHFYDGRSFVREEASEETHPRESRGNCWLVLNRILGEIKSSQQSDRLAARQARR